MRNKIIHFNSKEGLVWRYETAEERLLKELHKNEQRRKNRKNAQSQNAKIRQ